MKLDNSICVPTTIVKDFSLVIQLIDSKVKSKGKVLAKYWLLKTSCLHPPKSPKEEIALTNELTLELMLRQVAEGNGV